MPLNGTWFDQPFVLPSGVGGLWGRLNFSFSHTGTVPDVTVSVQPDASGVPSGVPILSYVVPADFFTTFGSPWTIPIGLSGLTGGATYHFVVAPAGTSGNTVSLVVTNAEPVGVGSYQTSTNGTTWTAHGGQCLQATWCAGATGPLYHTIEDGGARWTFFGQGTPFPSAVTEYCGSLRSSRGCSYSGGLLVGVN